jgi:hypothetical protein
MGDGGQGGLGRAQLGGNHLRVPHQRSSRLGQPDTSDMPHEQLGACLFEYGDLL